MTRKLSLTAAVAVAALSVGAPAAFGQGGQLSRSQEPVLAQPDPTIVYGLAQSVARARALEVGSYGDAYARKRLANGSPQSSVAGYRDANERGAEISVGQSNVPEYRDSVVLPTSSGSEIEWPQVGVGLGIGLLLALGLGLFLRATNIRPFAH